MLSNAYLLAKFRFDTAENERKCAEILPKTDNASEPSFAPAFAPVLLLIWRAGGHFVLRHADRLAWGVLAPGVPGCRWH